MKLSLLTNGWGMMFGVPTAVVDKYLKLSTPSQLKVLLYLLRHQCTEIDTAEISKALSINEELIEEALIFWEQTELFSEVHESPADIEIKAAQEKTIPNKIPDAIATASDTDKNINTNININKNTDTRTPIAVSQRSSSEVTLTPSEIASELRNNNGMMELFRMAEQLIGEPLNHMQQRSLLWQYQYLQVPGDIILTVMSYCRSMDKNSMQYSEKLLYSWWNKGICTMQQINDAIVKDQESRSYHGMIARTLDMQRPPTPKQREFFDSWQALNIPIDLIRYAYEKTIEQTDKRSLPYMNKILTDWTKAGYKTREEVDLGDKLTQNSNSIKNKKNTGKKKADIPESPMADAYRALIYNINE